MTSKFKTFLLLALLSGLILFMGQLFGGRSGLMIALVIALVMNVGSYWFSDKIVLAAYKAREVAPEESPMLHKIVEELAREAGVPKPRICVIPEEAPNAFATGRDPQHAVVAVTQGLMRLLSPQELRGVLAHEMGHVVNRDILIQSVASVLATVVMYLANMLQFAAIFGGGRRDEEGGGGGAFGVVAGLLMAVLAPIAASLIQFAISRSREYLADATGARLSHSPESLASALAKLDGYSRQIPMQSATPQTANMFIVSPFAGLRGGVTNLFTTHPPIQDRIARLQQMARTGSYNA
ncbi:Protease HtpX homolog [uncultured delta proteobacterium]|uniref:Protease HtpX homolog n=1 Tax=uncultured delta proteobacterium TaxID=34034 RepID=A0A212K071_9DELT|nr:Protease HtpX homolog [uncultured delta proteobacterium]